MEQILKYFKIGLLLRSLFAGVFFLIAFEISTEGVVELLKIDPLSIFRVIFPVSLFSGVTIYGLHRSILYPPFEWLLSATWVKQIREKVAPISDNSIDTIKKIWNLGAKDKTIEQHYAEKIETWADVTHLQYVSSWCIFAGTFVGRNFTKSSCHGIILPLMLLASLFFCSGLVSDCRLRRVIETLTDQDFKPTQKK